MNFENGPQYKLFLNKKIMSIDYGTKIVGFAQFCPGSDPFPYLAGSTPYQNDQNLIQKIKNRIESEFIDLIVLGLPLYLDGNESMMTKKVKLFAQDLKVELSIPLYLQDEGLSTFEALDRMKNSPRYLFKVNKQDKDALAASIILEDFLMAPFIHQV
ncbi:MAG: Holliday junction resolvase RuvX [Bacteriovoracaceae bacterium]|nr:Holliday junction resolvase RuvX [Bacteriovoracaceae bacterium]